MQDEIIKHTKKAYESMKDPSKTWVERILEIIIEICIIVFAVSLSIWLHERSEHKQQQAEVKEFLLGLKDDLKVTVDSCREALGEYHEYVKTYSYLSSLDPAKKPDSDSLNYYFARLGYSPDYAVNISRFDGFKTSGKLDGIENKKLLADILKFYQHDIGVYRGTINFWDEVRFKLGDFIDDHLVKHPDGTDNRFEVLTMPKAKLLCTRMIPWPQLFDRHVVVIRNAENIISEIGAEYK